MFDLYFQGIIFFMSSLNNVFRARPKIYLTLIFMKMMKDWFWCATLLFFNVSKSCLNWGKRNCFYASFLMSSIIKQLIAKSFLTTLLSCVFAMLWNLHQHLSTIWPLSKAVPWHRINKENCSRQCVWRARLMFFINMLHCLNLSLYIIFC